MSQYMIIKEPSLALYESPEKSRTAGDGAILSNVSDELLYGSVCLILEDDGEWLHILTFYGYAGYLPRGGFLFTDKAGKDAWLLNTKVTLSAATDVLSSPSVHGICCITLPRGSVVQSCEDPVDGWQKIRLADGQEGYVPEHRLGTKRFGEVGFTREPEFFLELQAHAIERRGEEEGGCTEFDFGALLKKHYHGSERYFRQCLTETAMEYLGTQYRWAGRSSLGIDCSGLVHMSYLLCGVTVYRDAAIVQNYPLRRIPLTGTDRDLELLRPGDTLYFPGHVAMYLGDGRYLHSTGKSGDLGVVCNSLVPGQERFRADLRESLYAAAGLRL